MHDLVAHPQSQAGAAGALGGKERLEYLAQMFRLNAAAGVGDREHESLATRRPMCAFAAAHQQSATAVHGIDGVGDEVVEHLANLAVEASERLPGVQALLYLDARIHNASVMDKEHA